MGGYPGFSFVPTSHKPCHALVILARQVPTGTTIWFAIRVLVTALQVLHERLHEEFTTRANMNRH